MGYYFEHVDENGEIQTYYPGSAEFGLLDRGPALSVVDPTQPEISPSAGTLDPYAAAPGNLPMDGDSSWADLLLALVQNSQEPPENAELVGIETFALSPITGGSSTGLKKILLDLIGDYDTIVTQYKYQQGNNSYYTYVNDISPDYPWLCSAALFIALILSVFSVLKRSFSWLK